MPPDIEVLDQLRSFGVSAYALRPMKTMPKRLTVFRGAEGRFEASAQGSRASASEDHAQGVGDVLQREDDFRTLSLTDLHSSTGEEHTEN